MIVESKKVSAQELKDFIQAGPLVTEIQTWKGDADIDRFRMVSRDNRVIVVSVITVRELIEVKEAE